MSSSLLSAKLQKLIKKTSDIDKDERFMATSDLCQELANLDEANQQPNAPVTAATTSTHNRGATPAVTAPFNGLTAGQTTGPTLDSALQLLIARTIVTLLEDSSTDVQTVSVKCLAILCRRISSEQLVHIIDKLATLISDPSKSESRDIYAIGLKTMIQSVAVSGPSQLASNTTAATPAAGGAAQSGAPLLPDSPSIGVTMAHRILSGMSTGLKLAPQQGAEEIDITCTILDVIKDVLNKFGVYVTDMHESLLQSLTPRLESPHDSIRKRTISTLSSLVPNLSDQSFHSFLELIIAMLARHESQQSTVSDARAKQLESTLLYTYLQMVSVVSTTAGARIGKYLNKIVPQLEKFIKIPDKSSAASTSDDSHQMLELWEWTLSAFESLIIRCTQEVGPYLPNVIKRAEEFVKYDPNYMYYTEEEKPSADVDMVDDTAAKGGDDDWGDDGGDDDGWGAGDDDDNGRLDDVDDDSDDGSWKVRRAAVKVLAAYIRSGTALDATLPSSAAATATDARTANFGRLCDLLLERLKERDQNVKIAIIQALQDLLRECALSEAEVNQPAATIINADAMSIDTPMSPSSSVSASPAIHLRSTLPPVLQERVPAIIEACVKQIKGGSFSETHHHIFSLLLDLSSATGGGLSPYLPTLVPLILQVMSSSSSSSTSSSSSVSSTVEMKMDGVGLLRALIDTHTPSGWFNQASPIDIQSVTSALILSFKDTPYIKYRVEVLHATASLITLLGRFKLEQRRQAHADYAAIVTPTLLHSIYSSLLYPTLQLHDVDQELKEQTLHSVGGMFYYFGKELNNLAPSALHDCMSILLTHRLTNELTRLASLRCLTRMTAAPVEDGFVLKIYDIVGTTVTNIGGTERRIVDEMISFLRKESQALKYEVVQAFIGIFHNNEQCLAPSNAQSTLLTPDQLSTLLKELSSHLSDSDLTLATGIFTLFTTIYRVFPSLTIESTTPTAGQDADGVLARVMAFMKSPLLQQQNIHPIVRLFQTIMQMSYRTKPAGASLSYNPHLTFQYLFDLFASQVASQGAAASNAFLAHVAQVVGGGLLLHVPSNEQSRMIQHLLNLIQAAPSAPSNGSESMKQFALLVLGELGRHVYLTALNSNLTEAIFFQCFTLESESIRLASSVAFGHVMMGNIAHFVPTILQQLQQPTISERKEMLTLILNSLKELIGNLTQSDVKPELVQSFRTFLPSLLPLLWSYASHREESVRSLVSDVIGGLVIIDSGITFPEMVRLLKADKPDTRSVVINALRYAIAQHGQQTSTTSSVAIDSNLLQQHLPSFLQLLRDPDLGVRRQAILTVSALVHSRSYAHHLLGPSFQSTILPILFQHLVKDPALVRVVDLGPFKHKVDDGFPLRKAAYQTLDTLLDVHSPSLDAVSLLTHLSGGLSDHDDIVILVYQMLEKCAQRYPVQMSQVLDSLPGKMMDGVKEKLKLAKTVPADSSAASSTAPPTGAGAPTGDATTAERAKDVLRAAVRCCLALQAMPTVHQCPQFVEFFQRILKTKMLVEMIEEMKQQSYR